jgi:hypothetical protein
MHGAAEDSSGPREDSSGPRDDALAAWRPEAEGTLVDRPAPRAAEPIDDWLIAAPRPVTDAPAAPESEGTAWQLELPGHAIAAGLPSIEERRRRLRTRIAAWSQELELRARDVAAPPTGAPQGVEGDRPETSSSAAGFNRTTSPKA